MFGGRATRGRVFVHRSRLDRRSVASGFSTRVRKIAACDARACNTRAHRVRVRVCLLARCVCNRVARCTDSTSSIGAPNVEEEEDRIDSPVTQTRDRATTSLTSASSENPESATARRRAKNRAFTTVSTICQGYIKSKCTYAHTPIIFGMESRAILYLAVKINTNIKFELFP